MVSQGKAHLLHSWWHLPFCGQHQLGWKHDHTVGNTFGGLSPRPILLVDDIHSHRYVYCMGLLILLYLGYLSSSQRPWSRLLYMYILGGFPSVLPWLQLHFRTSQAAKPILRKWYPATHTHIVPHLPSSWSYTGKGLVEDAMLFWCQGTWDWSWHIYDRRSLLHGW